MNSGATETDDEEGERSVKAGHISIPKLRDAFTGTVIAPGDAVYDRARSVHNGAVDRHPAVIIRPRDASEVSRVVSLARDTGLELAVRSGGHSGAGHGVSDGGVVLDLADLKALDIDPTSRTAWAQTGLTAGEYTTRAGAYGLATGFGDTGSVGIGGITLGGGIGFLVRKHGMTIDDLLAAEVVTADGDVLHVDEQEHPDLFWAIRGGGGNFGVATRFTFRLHDVGRILGGQLYLPATPEVITGFIEEAQAAPEELSTIANVMNAPPIPEIPEEHHGRLILWAFLVHAGGGEAGERAVAPFRALATPIADRVRPMTYPEMYDPAEDGPKVVAVSHTMLLDEFDRASAEAVLEHLEASTAPMRVAHIRALGGAMARVPDDATAFAHRGRRFMIAVAALVERPENVAKHQPWVARFASALRKGATGAYVNFLGDEGPERVREAYPGTTWDRLAAVKARYDPTNLFRMNQNVPPAMRDATPESS